MTHAATQIPTPIAPAAAPPPRGPTMTQADFQELSAKYRDEARRLMQTLDETLEPARKQVEQRLKQRLAQEGMSAALGAPVEKMPENTEKSRDREQEQS